LAIAEKKKATDQAVKEWTAFAQAVHSLATRLQQ